MASRGIERVGLTEKQVRAAELGFQASAPRTSDDTRPWNYPDRIYREQRERPLLIVHLLQIKSDREGYEHDKPVVAWSISFPTTGLEEKRVEFVVNTTWLRENYRDDIDEDEMSGESE